MSFFFNYNGAFYIEGTPVIHPDNHSFRYGNGLFETIKADSFILQYGGYHFERLFHGLQVLDFDVPEGFTPLFLTGEIVRCLKKNGLGQNARIRLVVFKGNGPSNIPDNQLPNYIIQTWPLHDQKQLNNNGVVLGLFHSAKKSCDDLANLKTNNYLAYSLAAIHAKKNNLDDCILLNSHERVCETTVANIFVINDKQVFTPPLSEGCVAGVMRRWILENIGTYGTTIIEKPLQIKDLLAADEVFLTNSIHPVRWVKQFENTTYTNKQVQTLFDALVKTF